MLLSGADGEPKYFEIPEHLCMRVKITHPTNEGINSMGLEWFGLPGEESFYYWNTLIFRNIISNCFPTKSLLQVRQTSH